MSTLSNHAASKSMRGRKLVSVVRLALAAGLVCTLTSGISLSQTPTPGAAPGTAASTGSNAGAVSFRPKAMLLYPDTVQGYSGKPLEGSEFVENQQRLLFALEFDKGLAGRQLDFVVVSVRTSRGLEQPIFAASDKVGADGRVPLELKLNGNWPVGEYAIRIGVDERLIASMPFNIRPTAPRSSPIKAVGDIKIVRASEDGKDVLQVPQPKANMRQLEFILDTTGVETGGADVSWILTALATAVGNNVVIGNSTTERWPLENTRLTYNVELPRDWPAGKYRIETKIGSQLLSAYVFDIAP